MILAKRENNFKGLVNYMEAKYGGAGDDEDDADTKKNKRVKKSSGKE